ncbi:MAG: hypothetical protein R2711_04885 [Acidimicrobiales bacterium]
MPTSGRTGPPWATPRTTVGPTATSRPGPVVHHEDGPGRLEPGARGAEDEEQAGERQGVGLDEPDVLAGQEQPGEREALQPGGHEQHLPLGSGPVDHEGDRARREDHGEGIEGAGPGRGDQRQAVDRRGRGEADRHRLPVEGRAGASSVEEQLHDRAEHRASDGRSGPAGRARVARSQRRQADGERHADAEPPGRGEGDPGEVPAPGGHQGERHRRRRHQEGLERELRGGRAPRQRPALGHQRHHDEAASGAAGAHERPGCHRGDLDRQRTQHHLGDGHRREDRHQEEPAEQDGERTPAGPSTGASARRRIGTGRGPTERQAPHEEGGEVAEQGPGRDADRLEGEVGGGRRAVERPRPSRHLRGGDQRRRHRPDHRQRGEPEADGERRGRRTRPGSGQAPSSEEPDRRDPGDHGDRRPAVPAERRGRRTEGGDEEVADGQAERPVADLGPGPELDGEGRQQDGTRSGHGPPHRDRIAFGEREEGGRAGRQLSAHRQRHGCGPTDPAGGAKPGASKPTEGDHGDGGLDDHGDGCHDRARAAHHGHR